MKSRIERCCACRARKPARRSSTSPLPNSRSKTSRGFDSGATGCVSERHETLNWYAHEYPESHEPDFRTPSHESSKEANRVASPTRCAASWSTDTPKRMSEPAVFLGL